MSIPLDRSFRGKRILKKFEIQDCVQAFCQLPIANWQLFPIHSPSGTLCAMLYPHLRIYPFTHPRIYAFTPLPTAYYFQSTLRPVRFALCFIRIYPFTHLRIHTFTHSPICQLPTISNPLSVRYVLRYALSAFTHLPIYPFANCPLFSFLTLYHRAIHPRIYSPAP